MRADNKDPSHPLQPTEYGAQSLDQCRLLLLLTQCSPVHEASQFLWAFLPRPVAMLESPELLVDQCAVSSNLLTPSSAIVIGDANQHCLCVAVD